MRMHFRWRTSALVAVATWLAATPALAASFYYGELLTTNKFSLLPDAHATATLTADFANFKLDASWSNDGAGSGLGSGVVPPAKAYSHSFVAPEGAVIEKAWLFVSFSDDGFDGAKETAVVDVTGALYQTKGVAGFLLPAVLAETITADVTTKLVGGGGVVDVTVAPKGADQDFHMLASLLKVQYSVVPPTRVVSAVPEPSAFLVFALGLAVAAAGLRGRGEGQPA